MYSLEIRNQTLLAYKDGKSSIEICKIFGISRSCLYNWIRIYTTRTDKTTTTKYSYSQIVSLQKQLAKLTKEHNVLQQAYNYLNPSLTQRLEIADSLNGQFPTKQLCRVIGIHHATFYNHDRRRVLVTQYGRHDKFLKEQITCIFTESDGRFGANKFFQKLTSLGIHTSLGKVSSLMKSLNLKSKRRNSPIHTNDAPKSFFCKNKLEQNFNQSAPNKFWVGDITCIIIDKNKYYICVVMELFSRKILAYELSIRNNSALTVNTFKKAFEARHFPQGLTFHSDQGTNYTSEQYVSLLKTLKVEQSFSQRGTPYDNAVIESFFSNMKRDDLHSRHFEYFDDLVDAVKNYIEHYNSYRPHAALGYKTPDQVETEYFTQIIETNGDNSDK